jgi:hypothetical protein
MTALLAGLARKVLTGDRLTRLLDHAPAVVFALTGPWWQAGRSGILSGSSSSPA